MILALKITVSLCLCYCWSLPTGRQVTVSPDVLVRRKGKLPSFNSNQERREADYLHAIMSTSNINSGLKRFTVGIPEIPVEK